MRSLSLTFLSALSLSLGCGTELDIGTAEPSTFHAADALPAKLEPDDLIQIFAASEEVCIGARSFATVSGTQMVTTACGSGVNQYFKATLHGTGRYSFVGAQSGKCLAATSAAGSPVVLNACSGPGVSEAWHLVEITAGVYQVRNGESGECLTRSGITGAERPLSQSTCSSRDPYQRWSFRTAPVTTIRVGTGSTDAFKCLTLNSSGLSHQIQQADCLINARNQIYWILKLKDGTYQFQSRENAKCLDVKDAGVDNGTPLQSWTCGNEQDNQRFKLAVTSPSGVKPTLRRIEPSHVPKCLQRRGHPNSTNGAPLELWACSGAANQSFWIPSL